MSGQRAGVIRWCDPPPPVIGGSRTRRPWALVAAQLRQRPGTWALIAEGADPTLAPRIAAGRSWWGPAGSFETAARYVGGRLCVWARHVGAERADETEPKGDD